MDSVPSEPVRDQGLKWRYAIVSYRALGRVRVRPDPAAATGARLVIVFDSGRFPARVRAADAASLERREVWNMDDLEGRFVVVA
jgi:hypothetical protein